MTPPLRTANLSRISWLDHGFGTRLSAGWPPLDRLALLKQIHSPTVRRASEMGILGEGDALISDTPGLLVGVKTADCVPILLADTRNRAVAAVHAGWKGTAKSIVTAALDRMSSAFGAQPADLVVGIGPCIGACCYEVGQDVAAEFQKWHPNLPSEGKVRLDLVEVNIQQLRDAGVERSNIEAIDRCTYCGGYDLESFRRDGEIAGRMISAIGIIKT